MDWTKGYTASYYACIVDPITWRDLERFELESGSINRTDSGLLQSADISCIDYEHGSDKWIRIWMDTEQPGTGEHNAIFTGLTSTPKLETKGGGYTDCKIQCYSVLKPAEDVLPPLGYYAAKGLISGDIIRNLLDPCPAPLIIDEDTPRLAQHIYAESNESNLTMVYKILDAIGWRIRIRGDGTLHVCPQATMPSAVFDSISSDCIEPGVSTEKDTFECPNVVRVVSGSGSATVYDHSSDLSVEARGREVWTEERDVSLAAGDTLEAYARRKMQELQAVSLKLSYDRSYHPDIMATDLIGIRYPKIDGIYKVTSQKIRLDAEGTTSEEATYDRVI